MLGPTHRAILLLLAAPPWLWASELTIRTIDQHTKSLVPTRVELLSQSGEALIADNAVEISRECVFAPMPEWLRQKPPTSIENPFSGTTQHYVQGVGRYFDVQPGLYALRVFKGPEYRVAELEIEIEEGESKEVHVALDRWHDAAKSGWFGADDHLHLARLNKAQNESLGHWMSAEGLHIANLVQMGTLTQFGVAPQYAFGDAGSVTSSKTLLLSAQEHPRTHLFGHALVLGASVSIDEREEYALYERTFSRAKTLGGISGFAHWGIGPAGYGLAVNVPTGNVEFLEVLNFEYPSFEVWYQLLNLGFPLAATAGTDFPCLVNMPGRERFYTKIDGDLTRSSFVAGIRAMRTFVTNGPMLSLNIDGMDIGSRKTLTEPRVVAVVANVLTDPKQDRIKIIELIQNGQTISQWPMDSAESRSIRLDVLVNEPSWFALKVSGEKVGETAPSNEGGSIWINAAYQNWINGAGGPEYDHYMAERTVRESTAHTSPIYFDFANDPAFTYSGAQSLGWIEKLDELENLLVNGPIDQHLILDWIPYSDGISAQHLKDNTPTLLTAISQARQVFQSRQDER